MTYLQKHSFHFRCRNGRRGSVIVLVVAVLALLAVIGTVYLVSSRTGRSAAAAGSTAENLDQAQKAINEQIATIIGNPTLDAAGGVGGSATLGPFGDQVARRHDIPEINILNQFGQPAAAYNRAARDQSWLVSNLYRSYPLGFNGFDAGYVNDLTLPQSVTPDLVTHTANFSPSVFNPEDGAFDLQVFTYPGGVAQLNSELYRDVYGSDLGFFRVVADRFPPDVPLPNPVPPSATLPNLTTNSPPTAQALDDAFVQMLPFSEANGTRYRFGLRIIDTSRMANLNVGDSMAFTGYPNLFGAPASAGRPSGVARQAGTYYNSYLLANPLSTFNSLDGANRLDATIAGAQNPGRYGAYSPLNDTSIWTTPIPPLVYVLQQLQFRAETPRFPAVTAWDNKLTAPFDLSDELALRTYGAAGDFSSSRPNLIWQNTLGNNGGAVNYHRSFYTGYSYSRDLRLIPDPPTFTYTLHGMTALSMKQTPDGFSVWPPYPARVSALPDIAGYTKQLTPAQACDTLAIAATNIATTMEKLPGIAYTHEEACAFAANYLTTRWNSWTAATVAGTTVYSLPLGPSFIDSTGICIRTDSLADSNIYGGAANDLSAETAGKVYLGFAAHPFINEVAASIKKDTSNNKSVNDFAIELYNPFNVALSLDDYALNIAGTDYSFLGKGWWVPAGGYFVLTQQNGDLYAKITGSAAQKENDTAFTLNGATTIYLQRRYTNRSGSMAYAAVDQYNISQVLAFTPPDGDTNEHDIYVARDNVDDTVAANAPSRWIATVHVASTAEAMHDTTGLSLGEHNGNGGSVLHAIPLYDRALEHVGVANWDTRMPLDNIADFGRIMRICDQINASGSPAGAPVDDGVVSAQLAAFESATDNVDFPWEAKVRFDFRSIPANYNGTPGLPVSSTYKPGDPRAVNLLDCLSLVDRVSDYTIDIGDNQTILNSSAGNYYNRGISKIRIPGQINVNTAPPEVLATIPELGFNPALIGTILAYRYRTRTDDFRIPVSCRPGVVLDFSNDVNRATPAANPHAADFPGYGIRSLAELQVPIWMLMQATDTAPGSLPTTLYARDQLWGDICSYLTVRSDTFVVYAYLEAIRQNPRYTGGFTNSTEWYTTNYASSTPGTTPTIGIADDPNVSNYSFLRVARRRWVAIVDRSQANFNRYLPNSGNPPALDPRFVQPRIVAQKDLAR